MGIAVRSGLAGAALCVLAACGGGGGGSGGPLSNNPGGGSGTFTPGVFAPRGDFAGQCTAFNQKMFLRSWTNELYLWYNEVPDTNPNTIPDVLDYFDQLKTPQTTPSGNDKDRFHFTFDSDAWHALSESGQSIGYGAELMIIGDGFPPRRAVVAFVEPGTPASNAGVTRGLEVLTVNGVDFVNDNTQAGVNVLNAAFFPTATGQTFTFGFRPVGGGATVNVQLTSADIVHTPVLDVDAIDQAGAKIGYILFNDHIATSEAALIAAVNTLKAANIQDLILDVRYNGGGFLDIANELAFMIAGPTPTTGQIFERLIWNNKNLTIDPISREPLLPGSAFHTTAVDVGGLGNPTRGSALPHLDLNRVYVITGPNTCSASESIINGLRGVNVQVFLIGSTTCGKPYGFYPQDNCGTTYFAIQFQGVNAMSFGDYPDGFAAQNQSGPSSLRLNGCSVADDFTHALGDMSEGRLAAALAFRANGNNGATCPAPSGFAPGAQLKSGQMPLSAADGKIYKDPFRENRILRQ